jgi:uncharacterized protein (TIGR02996 family)
VASPRDDTPRLVYADWLEENGRQEEAEFIRLECRLEAIGPDFPDYIDMMLRREELRLWLQAHSPGPRVRLKEGWRLDPRGWWHETYQGFPRSLRTQITGRLGARGIKRVIAALEEAFRRLPTRKVLFTSISIEDLAELLKQPAVAAIDRLSIFSLTLDGDEAARMITECPHLRNLRGLGLLQVGEAGASTLGRWEQLSQIEWLSLDPENLTPAAIRSLAGERSLHNVRHLLLPGTLNPASFEELCRLPPLPQLHTVNLEQNSFPLSSWQAFASSTSFPHLRRLELAGTDLSDGQLTAFTEAKTLRLTALDLGSCAIGNEGVQALVAAPGIESLQLLNLASNRLGPTAAKTLAACRQLAQLKYLDLNANPLGATGLSAIARSKQLRNLTALFLYNCLARSGGPSSVQCYEFLEKLNLPKLRLLDLSNLPLGPRTARLLTTEKFHNLTRLGLGSCRLTDAALAALVDSPHLQNLIELQLNGNGLKTGVKPLINRSILPRLSRCLLKNNPLDPGLARKLARRPGFILPQSRDR